MSEIRAACAAVADGRGRLRRPDRRGRRVLCSSRRLRDAHLLEPQHRRGARAADVQGLPADRRAPGVRHDRVRHADRRREHRGRPSRCRSPSCPATGSGCRPTTSSLAFETFDLADRIGFFGADPAPGTVDATDGEPFRGVQARRRRDARVRPDAGAEPPPAAPAPPRAARLPAECSGLTLAPRAFRAARSGPSTRASGGAGLRRDGALRAQRRRRRSASPCAGRCRAAGSGSGSFDALRRADRDRTAALAGARARSRWPVASTASRAAGARSFRFTGRLGGQDAEARLLHARRDADGGRQDRRRPCAAASGSRASVGPRRPASRRREATSRAIRREQQRDPAVAQQRCASRSSARRSRRRRRAAKRDVLLVGRLGAGARVRPRREHSDASETRPIRLPRSGSPRSLPAPMRESKLRSLSVACAVKVSPASNDDCTETALRWPAAIVAAVVVGDVQAPVGRDRDLRQVLPAAVAAPACR